MIEKWIGVKKLSAEVVYVDVFENKIVLESVVSNMIMLKHPETLTLMKYIPDVLLQPDEIKRSIHDERVLLYYKFEATVLDGKHLVVVAKRVERNFITTFYVTDRVKSGDIMWTKPT